MPKYEVSFPNGKTYEVESPTRMTDEQAYNAVMNHLSGTPQPTAGRGGVLPSLTEAFVTGITSIPGGITDLLGAVGVIDKPEEWTAYKFSEGAEKVTQDILGINPEAEATTAETGAQALGSLASFFVPGLGGAKLAKGLGAGAKGAAMAGRVATGIQAGALGAKQQAESIRAQEAQGKVVPEANKNAAIIAGSLIGLTDLIPLEKYLGPLEAVLSKVPLAKAGETAELLQKSLPGIIKSATVEGAQEGVSQLAQNIVEKGLYNPDLDLTEGLLGNAAAGGFAGGTIGAILELTAGRKIANFNRKQTQLFKSQQEEARAKAPQQIRGEAITGINEIRAAAPAGEIKITSDTDENGVSDFVVRDAANRPIARFSSVEAATIAARQYEQESGGKVTLTAPTLTEAAKNPVAEPPKAEQKKGKKIAKVLKAEGALNPAPVQAPASPEAQAATVQSVAQAAAQTPATPAEAATLANPSSSAKPIMPKGRKRIAPVAAPVQEGIPTPPVSTTAAEIPAPVTPVSRDMEFGTADERAAIRREIAPQAETFRDMTPEQQAAYAAELDRRYPGRTYSVPPVGTPTAPQAIPAAQTPPVSPSEAPPAAVPQAPAPTQVAPTEKPLAALFVPNTSTTEGIQKLEQFKARRAEIAAELNKRLAPLVGGKARVNLTDAVLALDTRGRLRVGEGAVDPAGDIISLSYNIYDPNLSVEEHVDKLFDVMNHEVIHSLSNMGLLKPEEMTTLFRATQRTKYGKNQFTYFDRAYEMYREIPGYTPEMILEEAVAEMFRDARAGRLDLNGTPKGIFQRIVEFFKRIFSSYDKAGVAKIFKDIESGKIGTREARPVEGGVQKFAIAAQPGSARTQRKITRKSYEKTGEYIKAEIPEAKSVLDYGAGLGIGADAMRQKQSAPVDTYELNTEKWESPTPPTFTNSDQIDKKYDVIVSLNVVNVLEPELRAEVVKDIASRLNPGGKAIITSRGFSGDVARSKVTRPTNEEKAFWVFDRDENQWSYQRGYDGKELVNFVKSLLPEEYKVVKGPDISKTSVVITAPKAASKFSIPAQLTGESEESFRNWFGKSAVKDKSGKPLVVYHFGSFNEDEDIPRNGMHFGTEQAARDRSVGKRVEDAAMSITAYQSDDGRWHWEDASGTTSEDLGEIGYGSEDTAIAYGRSAAIKAEQESDVSPEDTGNITAAYLSIENPKRVVDVGGANGEWEAEIAKAKAEGYDGIVYRNKYEDKGSDSYIAFEPTQIKSVNNVGTFSKTDPRIKFSIPAQLTGESEQEFARWWGDGKHTLETADGTPVPVYTGTSKDKIFESFQEKDRGIWVTTRPEGASEYALDNESMKPGEGRDLTSRVIPLYARIKNPLDLSTREKEAEFYRAKNIRFSDSPDGYKKMQAQAGRYARHMGYDSIEWGPGIYAIFNAKDLKSTFNRFEPGAAASKKFSIPARLIGESEQEFKRWWKRSKAVDRNGNPLVYYHGRPRPLREGQFNRGASGALPGEEGPYYFSPDAFFASDYADLNLSKGGDRKRTETGTMYPVFLSVQNPWDYQSPRSVDDVIDYIAAGIESGKIPESDLSLLKYGLPETTSLKKIGLYIEDGDWDAIELPAVQRAIRDLGFDGFYLVEDGVRNLAVYKPQQIKSIYNQFEPSTAESRKLSIAADLVGENEQEFKFWWADSKIVDKNGMPLVVYHGTKKEFDEFVAKYGDGLIFFSTNPEFAGKWPVGTGGLREPEASVRADIDEARKFERSIQESPEIREIMGEDYNAPDFVQRYDAARAITSKKFKEKYSPYSSAMDYEQKAGIRIIPALLSVQKPFDPRTDYKVVEGYLNSQPKSKGVVDAGLHKSGNWVVYEDKGVIDLLKSKGYDGIWLAEETGGPHETIAVFNPRQIKSVFNQFKPGAADSRKFSVAPEIKTAEGIAQNVARVGEATQAEADIANQSVEQAIRKISVVPKEVPMPPGMSAADEKIFATAYIPSSPGVRIMEIFGGFGSAEGRTKLMDRFRVEFVQQEGQIEKYERAELIKDAAKRWRAGVAEYSSIAALDQHKRHTHLTLASLYSGAIKVMALDKNMRPVAASDPTADPDSLYLDVSDDPDNALFKVMEMVTTGGPNGDSLLRQFRSYAIAQVSKRRIKEGKKVPSNVTAQYIAEADNFGVQYPVIAEAFTRYQTFNTQMIQAAADAGAIPQSLVNELTDDQNYFSMYRELDDGAEVPVAGGGVAKIPRFKEYRGSVEGNVMADPFEAIVHNVMFWTNLTSRTIASRKAYELGKRMGIVRQLKTYTDPNTGNLVKEQPDPAKGEDPRVLNTRVNGNDVRFATTDPLFATGLMSTDFSSLNNALRYLGMPADILRESVTRDPGFMIANLLRDSVSTWSIGSSGANPAATFKGLLSAASRSDTFKRMYRFGTIGSFAEAQKSPRQIVESMKKKIIPTDDLLSLTGAVKAGWDKLELASEASDAATRIAVYEDAIKNGATEFTAAYRALSIMNFSRSGHSSLVRGLSRVIPFLNARIQGFDVLYRGLKTGVMTATGQEQLDTERTQGVRVLYRAAGLAAASLLLHAMQSDDDEYKNIPRYIKDSNTVVGIGGGKFITIPKPFEAGFLFMTVPTTMYDVVAGDRSSRSAMKLFAQQFGSTFGFSPFPQFAAPIIENYINVDLFTGQPLISPGIEKLDPSLQYNASTSYVARGLGELSKYTPFGYSFESGRFEGVSPIKIDNLITGYGGPIGSYISMALGGFTYAFGSDNQGLPVPGSKLPVIRRFFIDAQDMQPQAAADAYELYQVVDSATRTMARLRKSGDFEAMREFRAENIDLLRAGPKVRRMTENLSNIRAQMRRLEADKTMSYDQKLEKMRELRAREARVTRSITDLNRQLGR